MSDKGLGGLPLHVENAGLPTFWGHSVGFGQSCDCVWTLLTVTPPVADCLETRWTSPSGQWLSTTCGQRRLVLTPRSVTSDTDHSGHTETPTQSWELFPWHSYDVMAKFCSIKFISHFNSDYCPHSQCGSHLNLFIFPELWQWFLHMTDSPVNLLSRWNDPTSFLQRQLLIWKTCEINSTDW